MPSSHPSLGLSVFFLSFTTGASEEISLFRFETRRFLARLPATAARGSFCHPSRSPAPAARLQATSERLRQVLVGDKDGSTPLCRLAPRCSPLREAIVDLRAFAVRVAAGRQARCGGPWGATLAPAAHIFDVCIVYTVCTPAPVPSVPTREALMPVFAPCPDWLGAVGFTVGVQQVRAKDEKKHLHGVEIPEC